MSDEINVISRTQTIVVDPVSSSVSVINAGPPGPSGSAVPGGTYVYTQGIPSASWVITHNLGYFPNVTSVDSTGNEVEGSLSYQSNNVLTITFSAAFSGKAYLS